MKIKFNFKTVTKLGLVMLLVLGCMHLNPNRSGTSVVTAQGEILPVKKFSSQFVQSMDAIQSDPNCDNFILFVHGRGRHPGKALKLKLLEDLESDYSAKVLMFHWPSWDGPFGFPEKAARHSADQFMSILDAIQSYKESHPDKIKGIKFTLLTHSMGSLVLEESVCKKTPLTQSPLFDTLVITAPASYTKGHADWVESMNLSDHTYIVLNHLDPVLGSAGVREMGRRLGKGLTSRGKPVELADNATYIDATKITLLHRYYLHRYLKHAPALRAFFDETLNGRPASFVTQDRVVEIHDQLEPMSINEVAEGIQNILAQKVSAFNTQALSRFYKIHQ